MTTNAQRSVGRSIKREQMQQKKAMTLTPTLASKLVSIVVYAEEFFSADGHPMDKDALLSICGDSEVQAWIKVLAVLAPRKRTGRR